MPPKRAPGPPGGPPAPAPPPPPSHGFVWCLQRAHAEQALLETARLLVIEDLESLERGWICTLADAGARIAPSHIPLWSSCVCDVANLLAADEMAVSDALLATGRICLLMRRIGPGSPPRHTLAQLRDIITPWFPEDAHLSQSGYQRFARLLPPPEHDTFAIAVRILASLSRIWTSGEAGPEVHRAAIAYLLRKKLLFPMYHPDDPMNPWPAPSLPEAHHGDTIWLVAGALETCFPDDPTIAAAVSLLRIRYRRGDRLLLSGLLSGAFPGRPDGPPATWSAHEEATLRQVSEAADRLWKEAEETFRPQPAPASASGPGSSMGDAMGVDVLWDFVPRTRGGQDPLAPSPAPVPAPVPVPAPAHPQVKVIGIASATAPPGRRSGRLGHGMGERMFAKDNDEPSILDSRAEWVDPRAQRGDHEAHPAPRGYRQQMAQHIPLPSTKRAPMERGHGNPGAPKPRQDYWP